MAKTLLSVIALVEAATGVGLMAWPTLLVPLLIDAAPATLGGLTVARIAGAALLALGVACWVAREDPSSRAARGLVTGMLIYNIAASAVLAYASLSLNLFAPGLWPAVLLHGALALWCIGCLRRNKGPRLGGKLPFTSE